MQGETGQKILREHHISDYMGSIVLIENGKIYMKSTAALRICKHLQGFWKMGVLFLAIPTPIRNFVYHVIAHNRYKWFGKRESCMIPEPDVRHRFLD